MNEQKKDQAPTWQSCPGATTFDARQNRLTLTFDGRGVSPANSIATLLCDELLTPAVSEYLAALDKKASVQADGTTNSTHMGNIYLGDVQATQDEVNRTRARALGSIRYHLEHFVKREVAKNPGQSRLHALEKEVAQLIGEKLTQIAAALSLWQLRSLIGSSEGRGATEGMGDDFVADVLGWVTWQAIHQAKSAGASPG